MILTLREQQLLSQIANVEAWELQDLRGWEIELFSLEQKRLIVRSEIMGMGIVSLRWPDGLIALRGKGHGYNIRGN